MSSLRLYHNLGGNLRKLMVKYEIDEDTLASLSGINKTLIHRIIVGSKKDLGIKCLLRLAGAFNMCAVDFIDFISQ